MLTTAAAIGHRFRFEPLQALQNPIAPDDLLTVLDQAERMGLIVSSADGQEATFTFAYNLVRQTLLARISVPRRQLLHLRAAEALALAHPKAMSQHAVATAHHVELVGALAENQRLVRSLRLAGKSALATAAPAPS